MEILRLILGFIITVFIGWTFLRLLLREEKRPFFEELSLSYLLGMGIVALQFVLYWYLNLKATVLNILLPWFPFFSFLFFTKVQFNLFHEKRQRYSLFEKFLFLGIIFEIVFSFFRALIRPITYSYDSVAIYAIRAKVFYEAGGGIPKEFFTNITNNFPNSSHPLIVPLMENWVYMLLGNMNEFLVKIIFPLFLVAILIIFYFNLRGFLERNRALLFTFLLATVPQFNKFSSIGYADFILACYFTVSFLYLFNWMRNRKQQFLILSAIFMGFSCWTKIEGFALFLIVVFIFFIFTLLSFKTDRGSIKKIVIFCLIVLLITMPWILLIKTMQLENELFQIKTFGFNRFIESVFNLERCPRILYEFQKQFFGPKKWNILWVIFLVLFFLNIKMIFKGETGYVISLLILVMFAYAYTYLLIPLRKGEPLNIYISTNLSRLFIHFTPLCVYWIARLCKDRNYIANFSNNSLADYESDIHR